MGKSVMRVAGGTEKEGGEVQWIMSMLWLRKEYFPEGKEGVGDNKGVLRRVSR